MSNLIKSGFLAFSDDDKLLINSNENKIIRDIEANIPRGNSDDGEYMDTPEEALAAELMRDAGLDDDEEGFLTMDTADLPNIAPDIEQTRQMADEMIKDAEREAEEIVSKAHDEAETMRGAAYEEAEQIKANAREEGYNEGYEEANANLSAEYDDKFKKLEAKKEELAENYEVQKEELIRDMEKHMVEILCKLIPSVTGISVEDKKGVLLYMINSAIRDMDSSRSFIIRVSSADYEEILSQVDKIYGYGNPAITIDVFEDSKLTSKQCLIETDNGIVDVSLDVQLDNLNKALKLMITTDE